MAILAIIFIFLIIFGLIFWQISILISIFGGINYVGSGDNLIRSVLKEVDLKENHLFCELGSGFGNGVIIASREFGAKSKGIEISPLYYYVSKIKTRHDKNIEIISGDLRKLDLSNADVIYCYLCPKLMAYLKNKFSNELKKGSVIISKSFTIPEKDPYKIIIINNSKVYFYKF
jgi:16S rRNA A1518/A1519 N6-dimethyltransferase RsmA/KsgA/DIM1 with predicted DNA glycosylase/AP lyase activity